MIYRSISSSSCILVGNLTSHEVAILLRCIYREDITPFVYDKFKGPNNRYMFFMSFIHEDEMNKTIHYIKNRMNQEVFIEPTKEVTK